MRINQGMLYGKRTHNVPHLRTRRARLQCAGACFTCFKERCRRPRCCGVESLIHLSERSKLRESQEVASPGSNSARCTLSGRLQSRRPPIQTRNGSTKIFNLAGHDPEAEPGVSTHNGGKCRAMSLANAVLGFTMQRLHAHWCVRDASTAASSTECSPNTQLFQTPVRCSFPSSFRQRSSSHETQSRKSSSLSCRMSE
jgi:hypothetical protein